MAKSCTLIIRYEKVANIFSGIQDSRDRNANKSVSQLGKIKCNFFRKRYARVGVGSIRALTECDSYGLSLKKYSRAKEKKRPSALTFPCILPARSPQGHACGNQPHVLLSPGKRSKIIDFFAQSRVVYCLQDSPHTCEEVYR